MLFGFQTLNKHYDSRKDRVVISKLCSVSGQRYEVSVDLAQADEMAKPNRRDIQDILPKHSAEEREFLMSGLTPAEFNSMVGGE
jgi:hypothetical protein